MPSATLSSNRHRRLQAAGSENSPGTGAGGDCSHTQKPTNSDTTSFLPVFAVGSSDLAQPRMFLPQSERFRGDRLCRQSASNASQPNPPKSRVESSATDTGHARQNCPGCRRATGVPSSRHCRAAVERPGRPWHVGPSCAAEGSLTDELTNLQGLLRDRNTKAPAETTQRTSSDRLNGYSQISTLGRLRAQGTKIRSKNYKNSLTSYLLLFS